MLDVEYASGSSSLYAAKQSGALVGAGGDCSKISEVPFQQAWRGLIWWIRIRLLVIQQLPQLEWRFWYP